MRRSGRRYDSRYDSSSRAGKKGIKPENQPQKLTIEYPERIIKEYFAKQSHLAHAQIYLEDNDQSLKLSKIPFDLLYKNCNQMNLHIKGFQTSESDFTVFCSNLCSSPQLQYLSLTFSNYHLKKFDDFFRGIGNIQKVSLDFQDLKIGFESDFTEPILGIKDFKINLNRTKFRTEKDLNIFQNYLTCLHNLRDFKVEQRNTDYLKLFLLFPHSINLQLILSDKSVDIDFCKQFISFKNEHNLNHIQVDTSFIMVNVYLSSNGIKVKNPLFKEHQKNQCLYLMHFLENDLKQVDEVPQFYEQLLKKDSLMFCIDKTYYESINQVEYNNIRKRLKRFMDKLIVPVISQIRNFEYSDFQSYNFNQYIISQNLRKIDGIWKFSLYGIQNDYTFNKLFPHMTQIQVNMSSYTDMNQSYYHTIPRIKEIGAHDYLIFYELKLLLDKQGYPEHYQKWIRLEEKLFEIISQRCQDRLRFYTLNQLLSNVKGLSIPQVFCDLLQE